MSNMSYCRFENTTADLEDCLEHTLDEGLSDTESEARFRMLNICADMLESVGCGVSWDEEAILESLGES